MPPHDDHQPEQDDLRDILARAAAGDEFAWREIVDRYSGRVFGLIRAQCNNPELAEEITQSAFCTVAAKLRDYDELGRFEQWLFRIAMNRLRDEMRRRKRHALPMEHPTLTALAGEDGTGEPTLEDESGEIAALHQALEKLSEQDRRVIHLRYFGELSFKQIAELLDQPLGTVLARNHRAQKKLKDLMGGPRPDD